MNLDKRFGVNINTPHRIYYQTVINGLGYSKVKQLVPFSVDEIRKALSKGDEHLNTLPLATWDYAGGHICRGMDVKRIPNAPMSKLLSDAGVKWWSCAETVCILKECARMMAEDNQSNKQSNEGR